MKLTLLSDVLDATVCPAGEAKIVDEFFSVGCALVGSRVPQKDAAAQSDLTRQAHAISMLRDFVKPHRPGDGVKDEYRVAGSDRTIVNDLFVPGHRLDEDGFMHIYFPVPTWTPLSSSFIARDWRFVALAWIAVIDSGTAPTKMVFVAADAGGRRVMAMVEPDVLDAFKAMVKMSRKSVELPGPVCHRCVKAEFCEGLQKILDPYLDGVAEPLPKDKTAVAQALFFQRMELETRIEVLEDKRKKADQILVKMCVDDMLRISNESIQLPRRKGHQWDYSRVRRILEPAGLWLDTFATIKVGALQAAMEDFPADVKNKLKDAMVETTTEPSISEAARHGRTVKTTLLRGITKIR
jgi:hypothetical protein